MNSIAYTQRLSMVLPEELVSLKQFILWRSVPNQDGKKPAKVPTQCSGYPARTNDPNTWSSFSYCLECMRKPDWATGIGFVFSEADPYCGIDLDNIWSSDANEGAEWAQDILEALKDTYGEASPSDTGYKIWVKAKLSRGGNKWPVGNGAIEIYDRTRFFTLTGASNTVRVVTNHQTYVDTLVARFTTTQQPTTRPRFEAVISEGHRHDALVSVCGTLRRRGVCSEAIFDCLMTMNRVQCGSRYDGKHIEQILGSIK